MQNIVKVLRAAKQPVWSCKILLITKPYKAITHNFHAMFSLVNSIISGNISIVLFLFTQHAGLPLQQRQDVLVEEQGAEAEEVPEAQVGHGAPVPHS